MHLVLGNGRSQPEGINKHRERNVEWTRLVEVTSRGWSGGYDRKLKMWRMVVATDGMERVRCRFDVLNSWDS
jgi:hypothetical protein